MHEWEEHKLVGEALKKQQQLREKELQRLEKAKQQEKGYMVFKHWLKQSLIKK